MKLLKVKGAASQILEVFIQDSSSTTGAGLTGLTNASAGLTCYYHRNTAVGATAVTLVSMTVGTFTSSGFKEVDATNMPGVYQLCLPDAAYATGADSVSALLKGATNMAPLTLEIQLTGAGLDPAMAEAPANVTKWSGTAVATPDTAGYPKTTIKAGTGTGELSLAAGLVDVTQTAADKVWASATRTLTAFSTTLALAVWDVLESAVATASSMGLKVKTNLDAAITTRATPAQVNTEVLDVMTVDTHTEPAAVPAATATLKDKIGWLCSLGRNKVTQTATTQLLRNDGDTATIGTSTVSDDGTTFTRGKFV